jgi:hypothetical protein
VVPDSPVRPLNCHTANQPAVTLLYDPQPLVDVIPAEHRIVSSEIENKNKMKNENEKFIVLNKRGSDKKLYIYSLYFRLYDIVTYVYYRPTSMYNFYNYIL